MSAVKQKLSGLTGPTTWERWGHWKSSTDDHRNRAAVYNELDKIFTADPVSVNWQALSVLAPSSVHLLPDNCMQYSACIYYKYACSM